ncbi:hypothetical protein LUW77_20435 [Streptomyces radiopugnans]|nr:hypothetical protein LUW77_20435 [Streptomyces radiopugnans]
MDQRSAVFRAAPVRALLAVAALLLGALAPAASALVPAPPAAPGAAGAQTADGPCAAECDRIPLLHRDTAAERHAPHPAGAALPGPGPAPPGPPRAYARPHPRRTPRKPSPVHRTPSGPGAAASAGQLTFPVVPPPRLGTRPRRPAGGIP